MKIVGMLRCSLDLRKVGGGFLSLSGKSFDIPIMLLYGSEADSGLRGVKHLSRSRQEKARRKPMQKKAFQDYYPDHFSHCYGCGRLNDAGLKIKSYWDGEESVCIHE